MAMVTEIKDLGVCINTELRFRLQPLTMFLKDWEL